MPNVSGAYCSIDDMRTGDIAVPSYTSKAQYVTGAAQEIDAALGHLYVTPFTINEAVAEERPAALYLKKLNWLLASGRMIADIAAAGESDNLNAYAKRMLDEACEMLDLLRARSYVMVGAELLPADDDDTSGPMIFNEDAESLLGQFYTLHRPTLYPQLVPIYPPIIPYDGQQVDSA